jgi:hypothetical protein
MKFRAISSEYEKIQTLLKVFQSICKLSKKVIFRLSSNQIQLIAETQSLAHFKTKCDIISFDIFQEYSFRGLNNENNLIYFDIISDSLSQVLNSFLPNIKSIKLKLSKKDNKNMLCIETDYPTRDSDRLIRHHIHINLIERKFWHNFDIPFGSFDVIKHSLHLIIIINLFFL